MEYIRVSIHSGVSAMTDWNTDFSSQRTRTLRFFGSIGTLPVTAACRFSSSSQNDRALMGVVVTPLACDHNGKLWSHLEAGACHGITGQDGSYLSELLLSKGYEVHGVVRRVALEDPANRLKRLEPVRSKLHLHAAALEATQVFTR